MVELSGIVAELSGIVAQLHRPKAQRLRSENQLPPLSCVGQQNPHLDRSGDRCAPVRTLDTAS
jgi:hypothetical protein